jgi:hypothetical protein
MGQLPQKMSIVIVLKIALAISAIVLMGCWCGADKKKDQ